MKRINEPCKVKTRPDGSRPYLFKWRGETYEVTEVQETWRLQSKWWQADGPERRTFYRCTVRSGKARSGKASRGGHTVVELYLREKRANQDGGQWQWVLARIAD